PDDRGRRGGGGARRLHRGRQQGGRRAAERRPRVGRGRGRAGAARAGVRRASQRTSEQPARARTGGRIVRSFVLVGWLVLIAGCAGVHRFHPNFYSLDDDIRLDEQLSKEVETELVLLRHSALNQLVNSIGRRLQDASPEPAFRLFPYTYHVVDSAEVNAFALPGGPVYLNMGIIE